MAEEPLLIDQKEAIRLSGLPRSTWYRLRASGRAPKPVRLDGTRPRWRRADILRWVERMNSARR